MDASVESQQETTVITDLELTAVQERCLRDQVISVDQPGTVLRDFQMLLDFLESHGGVEAGGKYNLLPIKHLVELDQALSHPLKLKLKRPQLRSHPYLQGLHLLLRASGLVCVEGSGDRARLNVNPAMIVQWRQLDPTEQYFTLLEAWLRFGRAEMIGQSASGFSRELSALFASFHRILRNPTTLDSGAPRQSTTIHMYDDCHRFALMDLLGLIEVNPPKSSLTPGSTAGIKPTEFGEALINLIWRDYLGGLLREAKDKNIDEEPAEDDPSDEEAPWLPRFGEWQPRFQPYFPEWRENLVFEAPEPREGTFVFRVSLDKVQRLIAMPSDATLEDLAMWILKSVNFDDDHLYGFTFRDPIGAEVQVTDGRLDTGEIFADLIPIGTLPLELGQSMTMIYDFGDNWKFTIKLDRIEAPDAKVKAPGILEKSGKAPKQYPNWDDD